MIKNERQYRISKAAARKFQDALAAPPPKVVAGVDPVIAAATSRGMAAQLADLEAEINEYEALKSGGLKIVAVDSLEEMPTMLIRARIASGLTQKELAERLGFSAQQIQRYEDTNYNSASFARLLEVAGALNLGIRHEALVGATAETASSVLKTLSKLGLPEAFVTQRLSTQPPETGDEGVWLAALLDRVQRIFGWEPSAVLAGGETLDIDQQPVYAARFKVRKGRDEKRLSAYTVYAHYLAMLLLEQLPKVRPQSLPNTAEEFYDAVAVRYETVSFSSALSYVWSLGIGVLPLTDSGSFDGAYWRVANRHVIALKPNTDASARWLFDLLHDYCHSTQHPDTTDSAIIELPPADPARLEDSDELEANEFASEIVVAGQGEALWNGAAEATGGDLRKLKRVLPQVAEQVGVGLGGAAYYMAHRLHSYGENWWGAAANLQRRDECPWQIARDALLEHIDLYVMAPTDRKLMQAAMQEVIA